LIWLGAPPVVISKVAPRPPVVLGAKVAAIAHDELAPRLDSQADASRLKSAACFPEMVTPLIAIGTALPLLRVTASGALANPTGTLWKFSDVGLHVSRPRIPRPRSRIASWRARLPLFGSIKVPRLDSSAAGLNCTIKLHESPGFSVIPSAHDPVVIW
jgi:hypothetical protein